MAAAAFPADQAEGSKGQGAPAPRKYASFYLFLVVNAACVIFTLGLSQPTQSLLVTRELGMPVQHLAGIESLKSITAMLSFAMAPSLLKRFKLLNLVMAAHGVRLIGFGVFSLGVALNEQPSLALVLIYIGSGLRNSVLWILTIPGFYAGTQVPMADRSHLNAIGLTVQRSIIFFGPLVGSGLAYIAETRILADAYPAWVGMGLSAGGVAAASAMAACGAERAATAESADASSSAGAPATAPPSRDYEKLVQIFMWALVVGGIGQGMFGPVVSLVLWNSYGLDSESQFGLFSLLELSGLAGSSYFIWATTRVSAARIASLSMSTMIVMGFCLINYYDLMKAPPMWQFFVCWPTIACGHAIQNGVDVGIMLTRVPGDKQAEVQSFLGLVSLLPQILAPLASTTIYASISDHDLAYNVIAGATAMVILAAFAPFIANWNYLYGGWDDAPTGQEDNAFEADRKTKALYRGDSGKLGLEDMETGHQETSDAGEKVWEVEF